MDAHRLAALSSPIEVYMCVCAYIYIIALAYACLVVQIYIIQNGEPCRSSSSQVSNQELMSSPSLEFTLGRPDWQGTDHD
jgi:hypothetical protein